MVIMLLLCEFSYGKVIKKCFDLNATYNQGYTDYTFQNRVSTVQADVLCNEGFIQLRSIVYSITTSYSNLCLSQACTYDVTLRLYICDCCKRPPSALVCQVPFSYRNYQKQSCEGQRQCTVSIGIVDLSISCSDHLLYSCGLERCKSRWVDLEYDCVPGKTV